MTLNGYNYWGLAEAPASPPLFFDVSMWGNGQREDWLHPKEKTAQTICNGKCIFVKRLIWLFEWLSMIDWLIELDLDWLTNWRYILVELVKASRFGSPFWKWCVGLGCGCVCMFEAGVGFLSFWQFRKYIGLEPFDSHRGLLHCHDRFDKVSPPTSNTSSI